ncbi:ATP-binding protein [Streptomyces sp. HSW2009]|uniref:ATP-binding protein n=1 Tax=Streptomyces sp. HSW2009 TaxID=3142890 RepID=UPI0032F08715
MGLERAGASERDRAVEEYVERRLHRTPTAGWPGRSRPPPAGAAAPETTLLLGPRGSGKTTLLRHLADWAARAPVAHLDLAALGRAGGQPLAALAALVFDLNARKRDFPPLDFPSFALLAIAVATEVDGTARDRAVREMEQALAGPPDQRTDSLATFADAAATLGAPALVRAALLLLPQWRGGWAKLRTRWRLARLRRSAPHQPVSTFLLALNSRYGAQEESQRERAEAVLFRAFVDDLCRAYQGRGARRRTTRCLVLLDNVDCPLGDQFLRHLLEARRRVDGDDPLLVVACAGSYPEVLKTFSWGGPPPPGGYPGRWPAGQAKFTPERVAPGLRVGQLRDLHRHEVEQQAKQILRTAGHQVPPPQVDSGVKWLGWAVYELTRGQPAATARVLDALLSHGEQLTWDERLRRCFEPSGPLVDDLLARLLPIGASGELVRVLTRASAAVDLAPAGAARTLWDEADAAVQKEFEDFCADGLCTLHIDTGDRAADGRPETPHPVLRFLLLRKLAAAGGGAGGGSGADSGTGAGAGSGTGDAAPSPWHAAHTALRARAAESAPGVAAYHALAVGDLPAAAHYLNDRFEQGTPQEWCTELCRLRRAPVPAPGGALEGPPWEHYEQRVAFLAEGEIDSRLRTVTRLLAASWIAPEPPTSAETDRAGDPYRNPLGDPYAKLYGEIAARFRTLAAHTDSADWYPVLLAKAAQYEGEPW